MQVVNSSFRITDRQGVQRRIRRRSPPSSRRSGSPSSSDAVWFDPHVIYDSLHGRWLLTMDGFDCNPGGRHDVHASATGTCSSRRPTRSTRPAIWTGSYLFAKDTLIDYTAPGTSTDKFAFASNIFSMATAGSCQDADDFDGGDVTRHRLGRLAGLRTPTSRLMASAAHDRHFRPARRGAISGHEQHASTSSSRRLVPAPGADVELLQPDRHRRLGSRRRSSEPTST